MLPYAILCYLQLSKLSKFVQQTLNRCPRIAHSRKRLPTANANTKTNPRCASSWKMYQNFPNFFQILLSFVRMFMENVPCHGKRTEICPTRRCIYRFFTWIFAILGVKKPKIMPKTVFSSKLYRNFPKIFQILLSLATNATVKPLISIIKAEQRSITATLCYLMLSYAIFSCQKNQDEPKTGTRQAKTGSHRRIHAINAGFGLWFCRTLYVNVLLRTFRPQSLPRLTLNA